jgi:hypothetical protein
MEEELQTTDSSVNLTIRKYSKMLGMCKFLNWYLLYAQNLQVAFKLKTGLRILKFFETIYTKTFIQLGSGFKFSHFSSFGFDAALELLFGHSLLHKNNSLSVNIL